MKSTPVSRFVVSTVLALSMVAAFSSCSKSPKTFASVNEKMQHEAKVAAESINKETGLNLDFSVASVKFVEQVLGRLAESVGKTDPQAAYTHAVTYGAYVGECLRKKHGGQWTEDNVDGKTIFNIKTAAGAVLTPVTWCFQRITGTETENIHKKVLAEVKALGLDAASTAEKK